MIYAGATYAFAGTGYVKLDEVYSTDVFNTFYIEGRYPIALDDKTRVTLGAQYYPQKSVGDDQIGSFSTWGYGLTAALTYGAGDRPALLHADWHGFHDAEPVWR